MTQVVSVNIFRSHWLDLNLILKHQCSFCSIKVSNPLAWKQRFFYFSKYFFQKIKPLNTGLSQNHKKIVLKTLLRQVQERTYLFLSKGNVILFVPFLSLPFDYGKQW